MEELQKAVEIITYTGKKFPKEELEQISANRDQAIPYLRNAVEKAVEEREGLDKNYILHLCGLYLLAQFQDREFFPKMMELATLPEETLDYLIGDVLTEDLGSILYNMYNGESKLLRQGVMNKEASDFARAQMLDVMGQLYLDQAFEKQELQDFLKEIVHGEESIGDYIYTAVARMICRCHFTDMLPELKSLYTKELVDEFAIGGYDSSVDSLFSYKKEPKRFCKSPIDAVKQLRRWPMFGEASGKDCEAVDEDEAIDEDLDTLDNQLANILEGLGGAVEEPRRVVKIGRNDPCPCGSGKKYKQCCLKKSWSLAEGEESPQEQEKWLEGYPKMDDERREGRVYLEDLYSSESIALDKQLYLALKRRKGPEARKESKQAVEKRKRRYLTDAYRKFQEIVDREKIGNFADYDNKYSIHYMCAEWLEELIVLLKEDDSDGILKDVRNTCKKMGIK